jgi:hypothetical protein
MVMTLHSEKMLKEYYLKNINNLNLKYKTMADLMKKLGSEKKSELQDNFDKVYDKYKEKAELDGFIGEIKFVIEGNLVLIYVILDK